MNTGRDRGINDTSPSLKDAYLILGNNIDTGCNINHNQGNYDPGAEYRGLT